jgi:NAD(P)-dependent dehydrogenase (short-subunit alcohol dehydrogenase family)
MAMGTRESEQGSLWVAMAKLPKSPGHPFYTRLNALLDADDFDRFVEEQCTKFYAPVMGRPSLAPGRYFRGVWLCMKYEIPQMLKQGGGAIVNTASVAGLIGIEGSAAYNASKHGVIGLTKTAALEYAQKNIRVNCVCPGAIQTPMTARIIDSGQMNEDDVRAFEPVGRWGQPSEIGEGVVWLLSEASSFVTGHSMVIDGGWVAR